MVFAPPSGNVTSISDFFSWVNTSVNSWFIPGLVLAFFFIIAINLTIKSGKASQSFAAASFICMIISVLFRVIELISTPFMTGFVIITGICLVWMHFDNAGSTA